MKRIVCLLIVPILLVTSLLGFSFAAVVTAITASSTLTSTYAATKANDGNVSTFYSSVSHVGASNTEWLQVDLGAKQYAINTVRLTPRVNGYGFPTDFKFQYSDDASTWMDVTNASYKNYSNPGGKEIDFSFILPVNARYMRLYATKLSSDDNNNFYLQIVEMKVDQKYVATASTTTGNLVAGNAVDGSTNGSSFYSSAGHTSSNYIEWLQLDLGKTVSGINLARITPRPSGYGFPKDFKLQYSINASTWIDISGSNYTNFNSSSGQQVVIPFGAAVNARYIRLYATTLGVDNGASYYLQVNEIAVEANPSETVISNNQNASSQLVGWEASKLIDNNVNSVWSSNGHATNIATESFTISYDKKYAFSKISITPRPGGLAFPVNFKIKYSQDGITFLDIPGQSFTNYANPGSTVQVFTFDAVFAKAFMVEATKLGADDSNNYYCQISEFAANQWDTYSDTWAAVDALGRSVQNYSQFNEPKQDKFVGMFYFLWLGQHGTGGPYDITQIIANNANAMSNVNSPPWGAYGVFHHWGQSQFGYYLSNDTYVIRKDAQMMSDAGIDTIIFDVSNGFTYKDNYMTLLQEYTNIRNSGGKTPKVAFLCPFGDPTAVVQQLYDDLYGKGLYSDLWFSWDNGKPLILADPSYFSGNPTLRDFFTFRKDQPSYFQGPTAANQWGWLEVYPQHSFNSSTITNEQVTVGVGQNAVGTSLGSMSQPGARGRSFHNGSEPSAPYPSEFGYNFAEQWGRALEIDPKFVFVTGWNEWVAMRFDSFAGYTAPNIFVDQFSQEFSRDIQPMMGGLGDNYYYQLVNYIRRYKGVRAPQNADNKKTITINGSFADWNDIKQEFRDDIGDKAIRNSIGWGTAGTYTNVTGRNDFTIMKTARDDNNIYFYVKTKDAITSYTNSNWMRLFIKTNNTASNWQGYNYVLNRTGIGGTTTTLEQVTAAGGWNWSTVNASIQYRMNGREMEIAIPRVNLGLTDTTSPITLEFKWNDNMQVQGDVSEFITNGDTAPNGRFNYIFSETSN